MTQDGWTALIVAAQNGHFDCIHLLVDAGADKEAMSNVRYAIFLILFA
jgi:ankyrin repeat protein